MGAANDGCEIPSPAIAGDRTIAPTHYGRVPEMRAPTVVHRRPRSAVRQVWEQRGLCNQGSIHRMDAAPHPAPETVLHQEE